MEVLARADDSSDRHDDSEAKGRDSEDIQDSEDKAEDDGDVRSDEEASQNDSYNVAQAVSNALHRRGPILMYYINASGKCHFRPYNVLRVVHLCK